MSVMWRIHTAIAKDRIKEVENFILKSGDQIQMVSGHAFSVALPLSPSTSEITGIAITTLEDAVHVLSSSDNNIRRWQYPRLLYFNKNKFNVSYWMPMIEEQVPVLNRGCFFVPAELVRHMKVTMEDIKRELVSGLFVRPDSGLKTFTGFVLPVTPTDSWEDISLGIFKESHPSPGSMLCISPARDLAQIEWRFWIVNRRVVACAPYSWDGSIPWSLAPDGAFDVAEAMAVNPWQPDLAFVVDVVQTLGDQKFWLNEINAVSTSGIYSVPLNDLLPVLRSVAILEVTGVLEYTEYCYAI